MAAYAGDRSTQKLILMVVRRPYTTAKIYQTSNGQLEPYINSTSVKWGENKEFTNK